ncbi:MAG: hypothetical protein ACK55D_02505 [Synechococcaceae cyanobacterium]
MSAVNLPRWIAAIVAAALVAPAARAALWWEAGSQTSTPSVCFAGDATTSRPDRVQAIKAILSQFEQAGNIRFQYQDTCLNEGTASKDKFTADIRIVIPNTAYGSVANVFNQLNPIPGKGCTLSEGGGGWSWPPNTRNTRRECLFNLHLGDDNYTAVGFGDPAGGATPFLNHPLHEVGHALGLSHEHARKDVNQEWVLTFLKQIPSVSATQAQAIYDAGFRAVESVRGPDPDSAATTQQQIDDHVARLQKISGYAKQSDADALRLAAHTGIKTNVVQVAGYGGDATFALTPYDPLSVMHYTWPALFSYAPGNYANTGLSEYDRLAIHILYPEADRVAELAGTRVLRQGDTLRLQLVLALRGATIAKVLPSIAWSVNGVVRSTGDSLVMKMPTAGVYTVKLTYADFRGNTFTTTTPITVLTPSEFQRRISAPLAAQSALF